MIIKSLFLFTWIGKKNRKCRTHEIVKKKEILLLFLLLLLQCSRIINKRNEFIHRNILFRHSTNSSLYRHFNKFMVIFSPPLSRTWTLSFSFFSISLLLLLVLPLLLLLLLFFFLTHTDLLFLFSSDSSCVTFWKMKNLFL